MKKIDVHAHWPYSKVGPDVQPDFEEKYRTRYLDGYTLKLRLKDMDADGVDMQVLSSPQQGWRMNDKLSSIVKEFPNRFVALASLPLPDSRARVKEGEFFGFLGPKGAGKSTTIKILTGLLRRTSGSAIVADRSIDYC
jgi:translation initiation factor RLI1